MRTFEYTLQFNTPAFLGNAEQNGQWRTPPIKAQLRQWWRMAFAADHRFAVNVTEMRGEEGLLFGIASDGEGDSRKSQIRIRLGRWDEGGLKKDQWPKFGSVPHLEVTKPVSADLYLGYGPVTLPKGAPSTLKANAAIQAGEFSTLTLAVPEAQVPLIEQALWLMDRYGTTGGRSRNGWGSYALLPLPSGEGWGEGAALNGTTHHRPWRDCLKFDWPHALGKDAQGPLVWQTAPQEDWKAQMKALAVLKIGLRTHFAFSTGKNAPHPEARHWLSYPVTNHSVKPWGGNARLPNQLRFKVRSTPDGKLVGVIFHVPHQPPRDFRPDPTELERIWTQVHRFLDTPAQQLKRIPE